MPPRRAPSHAVVGPIVVDWFRGGPPPPGATVWALTHAHADHYGGLSPAWPSARPILATAVTAALATHLTGAPRSAFSIVDIGAPPAPVPGAAGWRVAAVDARHCPGAACFLFLGPGAQRVLHTGDCRATPALVAAVAALAAAHGPVTALHLDTTYAHPRHTFPDAGAAVAAAVDAARGALADAPGAIVAVQSYVVGKEPLLAALAAACGRVGVSPRRLATLRLAAPAVRGDLDVASFVSSEDDGYKATRVRVTQWGALAETWPFFKPNFVAADALARAAGADSILCIVPTGWAAAAAAARGGADRARGDARVLAIPYSEHSSFDELRALVAAVRPARLVPTVGGASDRDAGAIVGRFRDLLDGRAAAAALWGGRVKEEAEASPPLLPKEEAGVRPPSPPATEEEGDGGAVAAVVAALDISTADAVALLAAAGGDATRAVNDWLAGRRPSVIAPRGAAGGLAAAPPTTKKRATPPPAAQPAKKTRAAPSPAPGQKPLASFFGGGRAAAPAAERAPPAAADQAEKAPPAAADQAKPPPVRPPLTPAAAPTAAPAGPDPARLTAPLEDFDPATDARWPRGARAPYALVAAALAAVDATRSRLAIARALANALRCVLAASPGDVADTVHLLLGVAAPEHEGVAPGLGAAAAVVAIAGATGSSAAAVRTAARASGDLGDAAAALSSGQRGSQTYLGRKPPPLTVGDVVSSLRRCAAARGPGAARDRTRALEAMLRRAASGAEARYLVRTALGCLRVGAGWRSVLPALGVAVAAASSGAVPPAPALAAAAAAAAAAYARCPDVPVLVAAVLGDGGGGGGVSGDALARLAAAGVAPGVPARPMLATMTPSSAAAVARLGPGTPFLAEFKYDGVRAQVHIPAGGGAVAIFSRGGETATPAWPDAAAALAAALPPSSLPAILDAEIVAIDRSLAADAPRRLLPFQLLAARPRAGQDADAADAARPVCAFVFDCLMLNGHDVTAQPLADRRAALAAALRIAPGRVELAHAAAVDAGADDDARHDAIEAELAASLAAGAEGVMLKSLASPYVPAARALTWLKLKADYNGSGGVDVDAAVVGGWRGHGRKAGWISPFLVAVRDARGGLSSVARVMSGFSDAFYKDATARLLPGALDAPPPGVSTRETPAFWFSPPFEVWQIKAAELSASRVHTAARGRLPASADPTGDRGLALRFPRFVRVRDDKGEADATHADELLAAYGGQARRLGGDGGGGADVYDDGLGGEWPFGGESE